MFVFSIRNPVALSQGGNFAPYAHMHISDPTMGRPAITQAPTKRMIVRLLGFHIFPFYAFSDARVSPARPRIARLHMQCVRDEINEIIPRSPREGCPTRKTPWGSFQEASLVVHTLEVHASSAYRGCQRCDETSERPTHHTLYVGGPSPYETSYY